MKGERRLARHAGVSQAKENHTTLAKYLRDMVEPGMADAWESLDGRRRGGWYGHHTSIGDITEALRRWQVIRTWATR